MSTADNITADSSKRSAKLFYYGNILAVLIPVPFFILWFGASILVYAAMMRHHPNPRVGYYTQVGAYHYYSMAGFLVVILTFAPGDFFVNYWLPLWILCAAILLPLSIRQILKINKEDWQVVAVNKGA